jgi:hypothetical protein
MHVENVLFSPILLVEVDEGQFIGTHSIFASPVGQGVDEVSVVTSEGAGLCGDRRPFPSAVMLY